MTSPMYCRPAAYELFVAQLPALETLPGLVRGATALALHEMPQVEIGQVETAISQLASRARGRVQRAEPAALLAHLHDELFEVEGFRGVGNDYYSPRNSYLPALLASKRGLPITLTLLYAAVAQQVGLTVAGINAPAHFLAQVTLSEQQRMYVDPFAGGRVLTETELWHQVSAAAGRPIRPAPELLQPATHGQWLSRMLNNLQASFAQRGQMQELAAMQELQAALWHSADPLK